MDNQMSKKVTTAGESGPLTAAGNAGKDTTWASLFKDNRKPRMEVQLRQFERKGNRLKFDFDDIDTVEHSLGYYLVGFFMGRQPGRIGVQSIEN